MMKRFLSCSSFPLFQTPKQRTISNRSKPWIKNFTEYIVLVKKSIDSKIEKKDYREQSTSVHIFAVTDKNITILREEVQRRESSLQDTL